MEDKAAAVPSPDTAPAAAAAVKKEEASLQQPPAGGQQTPAVGQQPPAGGQQSPAAAVSPVERQEAGRHNQLPGAGGKHGNHSHGRLAKTNSGGGPGGQTPGDKAAAGLARPGPATSQHRQQQPNKRTERPKSPSSGGGK